MYYSKGAQTGIFAILSSGSSDITAFAYVNQGQIQTLHWEAALHGCSLYHGQPDLCLYDGLEALLPEAMRQEKDKNFERATRNFTSTKLTYEQAPFHQKAKVVDSVTN